MQSLVLSFALYKATGRLSKVGDHLLAKRYPKRVALAIRITFFQRLSY